MATNDKERRPLLLPLMVTSACIALAVVHLIYPRLKIDIITLGLLLGAALPWLAPILKSIELPGGLKFELQEFKKEVRENVTATQQAVQGLGDRVDSVERLVFQGATPDQEAALTESIAGFRQYIESNGLTLPSATAVVKITPNSARADYRDDGTIEIGGKVAEDVTVVLHEYAHYALNAASRSSAAPEQPIRSTNQPAIDQRAWKYFTEAALADYLVASYQNDPVLGRIAALFSPPGKTGGGGVRNLHNEAPLVDPEASSSQFKTHQDSQSLSGLLWELREAVDRRVTDLASIAAWLIYRTEPERDFLQLVLDELSARLPSPKRSVAITIVRRRDQRSRPIFPPR